MEKLGTRMSTDSILYDENAQTGTEDREIVSNTKQQSFRSALAEKLNLRSSGSILDQENSRESLLSQEISNLMTDIIHGSDSSSSLGGKTEVPLNRGEEHDENVREDLMLIEARMGSIKDRGQGSTNQAFRLMDFLNKYEVKQGSTKPKTHGFMGIKKFVCVPIEENYDVNVAYHDSIFPNGNEQQDPEDFCFAECLSNPFFQWFGDCDFKWTKDISTQEMNQLILKMGKACVLTLKKFFPQFETQETKEEPRRWNLKNQEWEGSGTGNNRYRILVASSGKKEGMNKNGEKEYGLGLHIYCIGRCRVTSNQALIMRKYLIEECIKLLGIREVERGENPWPSVIDEGVLKGLGGVRMLYCSKIKPCPSCSTISDFLDKNQEKKEMVDFFKSQSSFSKRAFSSVSFECSKCNGKKKILSRQSYKPLFVMNSLGKIDKNMDWLCKDRQQAIFATSIRTGVTFSSLDPNEAWTWPKDLGDYNLWLESLSIKEKRPLQLKPFSESKIAEGTVAKKGQIYSANSDETQIAKAAIENLRDGIYQGIRISEGLRRREKYIFRLNVDKGMDPLGPARWCCTCEKHHENRSYFEFKLDGIYQGSYSEDCNGRYTKFPISDELTEILFGLDSINAKRKKKSKLSVSSVNANFVIPNVIDETKPSSTPSNGSPQNLNNSKLSDVHSTFKNYLSDVRNLYINSTYVDQKRKQMIENEKKKWKTNASKKANEKRPTNVPLVYIDDEGREQTTDPVSLSNLGSNTRGNGIIQKKASQTIQWSRCLSDR